MVYPGIRASCHVHAADIMQHASAADMVTEYVPGQISFRQPFLHLSSSKTDEQRYPMQTGDEIFNC